uniref:Nuclear receptor domain-containing protein n=1 Tax=Caenorhabditis tropicalis TaxID=1561998 RepID=A0A1I7T6N5_9PELO
MDYTVSKPCKVCGQGTDGKRHYGAWVCRACAAFFRRSMILKNTKKCRENGKCDFMKNGFFTCKYCRLQKCLRVGMSPTKFVIDEQNQNALAATIPTSMDVFCGRSNLIIFCAPQLSPTSSPFASKNYIDLHYVIAEAQKILDEGPETPIQSEKRLKKLALGLEPILKSKVSVSPNIKKYGKDEALAHMEYDILAVSKWFSHFDEFHQLPKTIQIQMIKAVWSVWWKLARLVSTTITINKCFDKSEVKRMKNDQLLYNFDQDIDMSWLSKYTVEELKFFIDINTEYRMDELTRLMLDLDPSDVELSFMLGQLCFHYVGKRFQGEILQVADKFQEILADDLHDYYINQMKRHNYSKRLASMMKINNLIQKKIYDNKKRSDLALVFDVFCVEVSHPEMFFDM